MVVLSGLFSAHLNGWTLLGGSGADHPDARLLWSCTSIERSIPAFRADIYETSDPAQEDPVYQLRMLWVYPEENRPIQTLGEVTALERSRVITFESDGDGETNVSLKLFLNEAHSGTQADTQSDTHVPAEFERDGKMVQPFGADEMAGAMSAPERSQMICKPEKTS